MRAIIQRVNNAKVEVKNEKISSINYGFLVLLGISIDDGGNDINYIIDKILNLRIFPDENDKMNNNISTVNGEILIVSQFTLYGDSRKGRRPSYSNAAKGKQAIVLYNNFIKQIKSTYKDDKIKTGKFGAMMNVSLCNSGPVTILLDSEKKF